MNFISSIAWVPRGKAKELPDQVRLKADELKELFEGAQSVDETANSSDNDEEEDKEQASSEEEEWSEEDEAESEVDLDEVADEAEEPAAGGASGFSVSSLAVFPTNDDDPYVEVKDSEDVDSEDEDFKIQPRDNLLAVAHVDEDANILEVYVYNEDNDDLYVHHDLMLPSYPLAMEWLSYLPGSEKGGNLVAVATMKPTIQIWDLDLVNAMEPLFELKGVSKKRKLDQDTKKVSGHSDAVLALSWNPLAEHVLASGSADETVILWDLDQAKPATTLRGFTDKVQAVKWRPDFADQILCGSCDKTVRLFDCRYKKAQATSWSVEGEVERILWSTRDNQYFYVATEEGKLSLFDVRKGESAVDVTQAHGKNITGLVASPHIPGLIVTTSEDKRIKVWDVLANHVPEMVFERKLKMGEIQFASMSPDSPFVVALGGEDSDSNFRILNLYNISEEVKKRFEERIPEEFKKVPQPEPKAEPKAEPVQKPTKTDKSQAGAQPLPALKAKSKLGKVKHAKRRGLLTPKPEGDGTAPVSVPATVPVPARAPRFRPKNEHGKRQGWSGQDSRKVAGASGGKGQGQGTSTKKLKKKEKGAKR